MALVRVCGDVRSAANYSARGVLPRKSAMARTTTQSRITLRLVLNAPGTTQKDLVGAPIDSSLMVCEVEL
jgi:hypothetical protein